MDKKKYMTPKTRTLRAEANTLLESSGGTATFSMFGEGVAVQW